VRRIIVEGAIDGVTSFNQAQVADERLKADLLAKVPTIQNALFRLEDHPVLRGCLAAFELDDEVFERRATAFHRLFDDAALLPTLTGAMLAVGDYSRPLNHRVYQLGSGSNVAPWRDLLTGAGRAQLARTRDVLGRLLDVIADNDGDLLTVLGDITNAWIETATPESGLDWRWYFVSYPAMREGRSGLYVGSNGALGYTGCMLDKTQMNSWYRDPFLTAVHLESGMAEAVEEPWFMGHEKEPRWLRLMASGTELQCVEEGFVLRPPATAEFAEVFARVCAAHAIGGDHMLRVAQVDQDGSRLDAQDRVQLGAGLVRDLVKAGL
jgi:hypothetical protein